MAKVGQRGRLVLDPKTSTGSGFRGTVTKVEGGKVYLKVDGGEGKYGPRIVKGSLSRFRTESIYASPMIKPPENLHDTVAAAKKYREEKRGGKGKIYRRTYYHPTTGMKSVSYYVKEDTDSEGDTMQVDEGESLKRVWTMPTGRSTNAVYGETESGKVRRVSGGHGSTEVNVRAALTAKKHGLVKGDTSWTKPKNEEVEQIDETSKAARVADKLIDKKRRSLVNLKPQTDSIPMNGNLMTQAPTSDASAPSPGIK